jgi:tRNA pseudouridine55 synthase
VNTCNLDGILLVDKPHGLTSHDVVARLRKILQVKKIGHAGTLDPMATGLLIILVGNGTKISQHLIGLPKSYTGTMKLGIITDSHDADGAVVETRSVDGITMDDIKNLVCEFMGDQYQIPPMFSAKKVNGKKLYNLARKGKSIEREPQFICVHAFEIDDFCGDEISFHIHCSKGTYVRTLAHDFGTRLSCGAHLSRLCRTAIDKFSLEDALALDRIEKMSASELAKVLIPSYEAMPARILEQPPR